MKRVILIGLSGTGKSTVAGELAKRLGYEARDTDVEVVERFGLPVPEIFDRFGEPAFRATEREILRSLCGRSQVVVATGGGIPADEANWPVLRAESVVVHLKAEPSEIVRRLNVQIAANPDEIRPLLDSCDSIGSLNSLWEQRRPFYQRADIEVDTTGLPVEAVVAAVEKAVRDRLARGLVPVASIGVPTGRSDIYVAAGLLQHLGGLVPSRFPEARRAWVVSDENVVRHWATPTRAALAHTDLHVELHVVRAGESSKSFDQTGELVDWMLRGRIDRRDLVIALGGGVVGDLAGFAASIVLRGVGLVQVPTSLLAMVDSSVGGKTGVNHPMGKNLIGAFYQPQLVLADPDVLGTLPSEELRAGWAEIIKHAMIERTATGAEQPDLLRTLERSDLGNRFNDPALLAEVVGRNVLIKAAVVVQDERESGLRRILNYGHTLGHAMEASGYRYLHGEAVALGMRAAAELSERTGRAPRTLVERQNALLDQLGLPRRFEGSLDDVISRLHSDKKAVHGRLTWVLAGPEAGTVEVTRDVPEELIRQVARDLGADGAPVLLPGLG